MTPLQKELATDRQIEFLESIERLGTQAAAAAELGIDPSTIAKSITALKVKCAKRGESAEHEIDRPVPEGYKLAGISDMRTNSEGKPIWYKFNEDREKMHEMYLSYINGLCKDIKPRKPKKAPKATKYRKDLMTGVFIGDAHIGMRAFGKETKHSNFDTDIATSQLRDAIDYLVGKAEPTETGLLVNVGDFMHANTQHNTTFAGTPVDSDTRQNKTMEAAAEVMVYMVDRMLDKHKKVVLVCARGNHDTDAASAVALILKFFFKNEPRVQVLDTDGFYHYVEYGNWLLGIHHGDKQKPESLAGSMARDMSQAWGRTTHRMWCCGHYHKDAVKTLHGCKYKIFGALPPPDSWHASHGYAGDGEMEMLTFRKEGGLFGSHVYNIPQPRNEPDVNID